MNITDLALQRKKYPHLSDEEWRFMLQQTEGRQRTQDKLPGIAEKDDWWYPARISCEQSSSEATAYLKTTLLPTTPYQLIDLTGGMGIDTYYLSDKASEAHYIEQNAELCRLATHNMQLYRPQVEVHHTTAEEYLQHPNIHPNTTTIVYIDPARRNTQGGKVYRIEDCEPNLTTLMPKMKTVASFIMIKLSPMLDITAAIRTLGEALEVYIIAVENEVKEVLLTLDNTTEKTGQQKSRITTINIKHYDHRTQQIVADRQEWEMENEKTTPSPQPTDLESDIYLYEPNAAILKAGAYKLLAERYGLKKMSQHTHLYTSEKRCEDFPGRVWRLMSVYDKKKHKDIRAGILTRNYPLSAEELRKKLKIKDSHQYTIIGARVGDKPMLLVAEKL